MTLSFPCFRAETVTYLTQRVSVRVTGDKTDSAVWRRKYHLTAKDYYLLPARMTPPPHTPFTTMGPAFLQIMTSTGRGVLSTGSLGGKNDLTSRICIFPQCKYSYLG